MSKAQDKRFEGIQRVNNAVVVLEAVATENGSYTQNVWKTQDRTEIAAMIRELAPLGRTERWATAVETWAVLVEDTENPVEWAFFQGGIWASHAA